MTLAWRDQVVVRCLAVGLVTTLIYGVLFSYRTDYLGHYLAGFAGTLMILSLVVAFGPHDSVALTIGLAAIGVGWMTESTIFKLAIFDPVDFINQSLGALVAMSVVVGEHGSPGDGAVLFVLSVVGLIAGFYFAFL